MKQAWGVVVQNSKDSKREIMVALSGKIPMPPSMVLLETIAVSVVFLETIAARRAVHFIHEIGIPSSIFEGDSEISINTLLIGI